MGKLKLSHECNNFPLPPNQLYIELTGESIKFLCEGKEIRLKTSDWERRQKALSIVKRI